MKAEEPSAKDLVEWGVYCLAPFQPLHHLFFFPSAVGLLYSQYNVDSCDPLQNSTLMNSE